MPSAAPRAPETAAPEQVLKATLADLLVHHMKHHQFSDEDVAEIEALLSAIERHPEMGDERAQWVVLHKSGPVLAHVTSEDELPRVGKQGDTALAVWLLQLLSKEPVPLPLLKAARMATPAVFSGVSHLVMLQAAGRGLVERSLRDGYPQELITQLLRDWQSLPELAKASEAKRQALALETLGTTWAFGYDDEKTRSYALATLRRLLGQPSLR